MKVKIIDRFGFQSFPLVEGMIEVSDQDIMQLGITTQFDVENQCVIPYDNSADVAAKEKQDRVDELKGFLVDTDYQSIKFSEGAMTEEEFAPIRVQRQAWRDEINQLEQ